MIFQAPSERHLGVPEYAAPPGLKILCAGISTNMPRRWR
jgi:hypothetical protein